MKQILTFIAFLIAVVAIYFLYDWYITEPQNKEPLPALLSAISALIMFLVAWSYDNNSPNAQSRWFRFNSVNIKGKDNSVQQKNHNAPTFDINKTNIDGNNNELKQN